MQIHHFANQHKLATAVAEQVIVAANLAITARGEFHWVLAGGTTPRICYELLCHAEIDWSKVHIWFGDERCLPAGDPERNDAMAQLALLAHVPIPELQIHRIAAEQGPVTAARLYGSEIVSVESLDLALLGMGEDGHTASLFPRNVALESKSAAVAVFDSPKPPEERVSLGYSQINRAKRQIVMVAGVGKRAAWQDICDGVKLPAARLVKAEWYVTDMGKTPCH